MSALVKTLFITGVILTILGSFLPWKQEGDFISYWTFGIRIYPTIEDNGGFLIVLLSVIVSMLIFRPLNFIKNPIIWAIVICGALSFASVFQIGKLIISRGNISGTLGVPIIQIGLVMVSAGSLLLLFTAVLHYFKRSS